MTRFHSLVGDGRETTAGWRKAFDVFILGLVSDGAPANLKMPRWLQKCLPANALLLHHVCDLCLSVDGHQSNRNAVQISASQEP